MMSEAEFDVDAAQAEYDAARAAGSDDAGDDPGGADGDRGGDKGGDPPGFKSYEDYVADGGDPDMYRGKKAYEAEHNRIDENKRLRRDVKGLQGTVQQTMDAVNSWQETERTKMRGEIEAELNTAMENEDPKAAVAAQKKLDDIDDEPASQEGRPENPVIQDFREANPMLDHDADEFNEEFNDDMEAIYNDLYKRLTYDGRRKATDGQIKRCLKKAMVEARELHDIEDEPGQRDDDRGESRRNKRRGGNRQQRTQRRANSQRTSVPKAEDYVLENPRNKRQVNAAPEVRDMIHKKAFESAKKGGKNDADAKKYADGESQRFEASLAR